MITCILTKSYQKSTWYIFQAISPKRLLHEQFYNAMRRSLHGQFYNGIRRLLHGQFYNGIKEVITRTRVLLELLGAAKKVKLKATYSIHLLECLN